MARRRASRVLLRLGQRLLREERGVFWHLRDLHFVGRATQASSRRPPYQFMRQRAGKRVGAQFDRIFGIVRSDVLPARTGGHIGC